MPGTSLLIAATGREDTLFFIVAGLGIIVIAFALPNTLRSTFQPENTTEAN